MVNQEVVTRIAKEADLWMNSDNKSAAIERFANLIASHVAEECAKACESLQGSEWVDLEAGAECADSIRSLYKPTA